MNRTDFPKDPFHPDPDHSDYEDPMPCGGAPKSNVLSVSYNRNEVS